MARISHELIDKCTVKWGNAPGAASIIAEDFCQPAPFPRPRVKFGCRALCSYRSPWMMKSPLIRFALITAPLIVMSFVCAAVDAADYPDTPQRPVIDRYHGVDVADDYRWLEDDKSPEVKRGTAA